MMQSITNSRALGSKSSGRFVGAKALAASCLAGAMMIASAAAQVVATGNGVGVDLDGDTNPVTDVYGFFLGGEQSDGALDPSFTVLDFEAPAREHGTTVRRIEHADGAGAASFSKGLSLQICEGPRHFEYNSMCTYLKPPSGDFAGFYRDEYKRPLRVRFDEPVCALSMAIYPTGGREGERFRAKMTFYRKSGDTEKSMGSKIIDFTWTENTFRWRSNIVALLEKRAAHRVDVQLYSRDDKSSNVGMLIDDLAFIDYEKNGETGQCADVLEEFLADAES